jgi:hypothetical protein
MSIADHLDHPLTVLGREITDAVIAPVALHIGGRYLHPEQGEIELVSGYYRDPRYGRISNHWHWTIVATGEKRHGYGDNWPVA